MDIRTSPYDATERETWDEFVAGSNNGTLFHRLDFLDYHPDDRFDEHNLAFYYKGQNLMGVMPLAIEKQDGNTVARSPYGGSYGGIVHDTDLKFRYMGRMVAAMVDHLQEMEVDEISIRASPREQDRTPCSYLEFHLLDHGFDVADTEVTHVVDLSRFDDDPFDIYEGRCRRAVRKTKDEGIVVDRDPDDIAAFYDLLLETYDRHGKTPTHTLDELRELRSRFTDRVNLSVATYDGKVIAGQLGFVLNSRTYIHMYNCRSDEHKQLNAVNRLIDEEIRWAKKHGLDIFDLGTSVESHTWNAGLVKFKESFGATGQFRTRYTKTL
jgi:hypothetical protein